MSAFATASKSFEEKKKYKNAVFPSRVCKTLNKK